MEDIVSRRVCYDTRQSQLRQCLAVPPMNRGYSLKGGPVDQAHASAQGVNAARLQLATPHLPLELIEIERGGRRFAAPDCAPLAMDDLLLAVLAVNFVVDLILVARGDDDRLRPDGVAQLQDRRFGPRR